MALDLTIFPLPDETQIEGTVAECYDRLHFDPDYRIFRQIKDISIYTKKPEDQPTLGMFALNSLPSRLWVRIYEEQGTKRIRHDWYGVELQSTHAYALKELNLSDDASPKNKAIKAFIDALPDRTCIILYWH